VGAVETAVVTTVRGAGVFFFFCCNAQWNFNYVQTSVNTQYYIENFKSQKQQNKIEFFYVFQLTEFVSSLFRNANV